MDFPIIAPVMSSFDGIQNDLQTTSFIHHELYFQLFKILSKKFQTIYVPVSPDSSSSLYHAFQHLVPSHMALFPVIIFTMFSASQLHRTLIKDQTRPTRQTRHLRKNNRTLRPQWRKIRSKIDGSSKMRLHKRSSKAACGVRNVKWTYTNDSALRSVIVWSDRANKIWSVCSKNGRSIGG